MDRIKELSDAFARLSEVESGNFYTSEYMIVAFYIKRIFVLASLFYPQQMKIYESYTYRIGKYGEIYSGKIVVDIEEDILPQYCATQSDVVDYLLIYYKKSPYWELYYECLSFDELDNEKDMSLCEFFDRRTGAFEEKLLSSLKECEAGHPLKKYYDLFEDSEDCAADDCVLLKSKLIPHYNKVKDIIGKEDQYLCQLIDMCKHALCSWLSGYSFSIEDGRYDNAYYISCDNSSYWYEGAYGDGVLDHSINILVAGELIDRCILELDKKHSFLPDFIKDLEHSGEEKTDD